jgi:anaerobic selenocysteine-containing dehydrogenase
VEKLSKGPAFEPYESPTSSWGTSYATARALREQSIVLKCSKARLSINQPDGFDCPGYASPGPKHTRSFELCENGAKTVSFELTKRKVTQEFFAAWRLSDPEWQSNYWLDEQGRPTEPMHCNPKTDRYEATGWDDAFATIGRHLRALDNPRRVDFYTSCRSSSESAFPYQIFGGRFGTHKCPDCSNMCLETTSVGLPLSIGMGKGSVVLEDFGRKH